MFSVVYFAMAKTLLSAAVQHAGFAGGFDPYIYTTDAGRETFAAGSRLGRDFEADPRLLPAQEARDRDECANSRAHILDRLDFVRPAREASGQVYDLREATLGRVVDRDDETFATFGGFHPRTVATPRGAGPRNAASPVRD
jgi:hypothetical protein